MVERLNAMPGVTCRMPTGAFYAFPNISGLFGRTHTRGKVQTATDAATYLLQEAKVALVPGEPFGSASHIRLSYATSMDTIIRGMDRMETALAKLTA
jgi:aspartate aminotransferase